MQQSHSFLCSELLVRRLLTPGQVGVLEQHTKAGQKNFFGLVLSFGFVEESTLAQVAHELFDLPLISDVLSQVDPGLVSKIPQEKALESSILPIPGPTPSIVYLVMVDPFDVQLLDEMRKFFPPPLQLLPTIAPKSDLLRTIEKVYVNLASLGGPHLNPNAETFLEDLLRQARGGGASDIHFVPNKDHTDIFYRVDGRLEKIISFHQAHHASLMVQLKMKADLDVAETRRPQNGRFNFSWHGRYMDCRISFHPTISGESAVIRLLEKEGLVRDITALGLTPHSVQALKKLTLRREGLVILTGPTGSGKTTTLYALLKRLDATRLNIMTLEQPVEYIMPGIRQTEIGEKGAVSFPDGVRSLLRQDPDVMLIGEIRDAETAQMALRAAMTGHLVFTTLHTKDVFGAFDRFQDFGLDASVVAGYLNGIISQRLLRSLCEACKQPAPLSDGQQEKFASSGFHPPRLFEPQGCPACLGTGYKGRFAVSEILDVDQHFGTHLYSYKHQQPLREYAYSKGFISLAHSMLEAVAIGRTSYQEVVLEQGG